MTTPSSAFSPPPVLLETVSSRRKLDTVQVCSPNGRSAHLVLGTGGLFGLFACNRPLRELPAAVLMVCQERMS